MQHGLGHALYDWRDFGEETQREGTQRNKSQHGSSMKRKEKGEEVHENNTDVPDNRKIRRHVHNKTTTTTKKRKMTSCQPLLAIWGKTS